MFEKPASGWAGTTVSTKLIASDGVDGDVFGTSVSLDGDVLVVGADKGGIAGNRQGAVYVFDEPMVVPGSGCDRDLSVSGSRRIGASLTLSMAGCAGESTHAFAVGRPLAQPVRLNGSGCESSPCLLSCEPIVVVFGPVATFGIESHAAVVGQVLCVQGICKRPGRCLKTTHMVKITVSS